MNGKVVAVTGCTSGTGKIFAKVVRLRILDLRLRASGLGLRV